MIAPVIFTRGRVDNQVTLSQMPSMYQNLTTLLVYPEEYDEHKERYGSICNVRACPDEVRGIAKRREWAAKNLSESVIQWQLDDDLTFCKAKRDGMDGSWPFLKFTAMEDEDWHELFKDIHTACDVGFKVGGLGQRISPAGIGDFPGSANSRVYTNTWFDFRTINPNSFDWVGSEWNDDEFLPEDFHIQCQMVKSGIPILNFNKWGSAGNKTQAAGGCATTRTTENHNRGMIKFADVWSECATLRWKDGWEKGTKKAALTIRLGKLWPDSKDRLVEMENKLRSELGAPKKDRAKELQKEANRRREEAQKNG